MEFRELQNKSPFLAGETRTERKQDEDDLLTYVAFLLKILKRTEGTIRQKLFAISFLIVGTRIVAAPQRGRCA